MTPSPRPPARGPRTMFMHTIDRMPATYEPGRQIAFASLGRYARKGIRLVPSLAQIRAEQRATLRWRAAQGFSNDHAAYGYARVEVPR